MSSIKIWSVYYKRCCLVMGSESVDWLGGRVKAFIENNLRGTDLLQRVREEVDEAEAKAMRERVERLRILEESRYSTARKLRDAGLDDVAEKVQAEGVSAHLECDKIMKKLKVVDRRIARVDVALQSRQFPHE
jgi:hypothetical protein